MQASNLAQAGHAFFALTHSMNMHGRAVEMVTPIGDKKTPLTAESAEAAAPDEAACKRAACERTNGSTRGCRERSESDAKVCVRRPRLQRARVRLCGLPEMCKERSRRHWGWGAAPLRLA